MRPTERMTNLCMTHIGRSKKRLIMPPRYRPTVAVVLQRSRNSLTHPHFRSNVHPQILPRSLYTQPLPRPRLRLHPQLHLRTPASASRSSAAISHTISPMPARAYLPPDASAYQPQCGKTPQNRLLCETAQRHLAPMCETALRHLAPHAQDPNQKEIIALWFGSNRIPAIGQ